MAVKIPPCACGMASTSWGFSMGAVVKDVIIFALDDRSVQAFTSKVGLKLGLLVAVMAAPQLTFANNGLEALGNAYMSMLVISTVLPLVISSIVAFCSKKGRRGQNFFGSLLGGSIIIGGAMQEKFLVLFIKQDDAAAFGDHQLITLFGQMLVLPCAALSLAPFEKDFAAVNFQGFSLALCHHPCCTKSRFQAPVVKHVPTPFIV